jgi:bacteriocin biosynthesis cyclodehydratase domain-containing protein
VIPRLPFLPPWYRLALGDGKVVLEHGQRMVCLEGRAAERFLPALLPLLDGTRTVDGIVRALGEPVRPAVERALSELAASGVLGEGPPPGPETSRPVAETAELLASLRPGGRPLAETAASVAACSAEIVGEGTAGVEATRLLRASGVRVEPAEKIGPGADLTICAPSPGQLPRLGAWNEQALEARGPWLQLLPFDGRYAAIGPLFLPGDTCCYECFRRRRAANLDAGVELTLLEQTPASYPTAAALDAVVGGLGAVLALSWLVLGDHYVPGAFYAVELLPVLALSVHHVHRVPRCPACSGLADVAPPLPWHKELPVARG